MKDIYEILEKLNIPYKKHDHPPVFTTKESAKFRFVSDGVGETKNLFLRNKKGDQHYLVTLGHEKKADLKELRKKLDESKLSFASPERMMEKLGLAPGSVTLLGLINNPEKDVIVILDQDLWEHEVIACHPNRNDATLEINRKDMDRFLEWCGHEVRILSL